MENSVLPDGCAKQWKELDRLRSLATAFNGNRDDLQLHSHLAGSAEQETEDDLDIKRPRDPGQEPLWAQKSQRPRDRVSGGQKPAPKNRLPILCFIGPQALAKLVGQVDRLGDEP